MLFFKCHMYTTYVSIKKKTARKEKDEKMEERCRQTNDDNDDSIKRQLGVLIIKKNI